MMSRYHAINGAQIKSKPVLLRYFLVYINCDPMIFDSCTSQPLIPIHHCVLLKTQKYPFSYPT